MNLYLVQHAEAKRDTEYPRRPFSEGGYAEIEKTAKWLATKLRPSINVIFHSGKLRAQQTAEVLADYLNPPGGIKPADSLEPNADPAVWAEQLVSMSENVMLVGHLPHLSKLTSRLLCGDESRSIVEFHNAGVVCMSRDQENQWVIRWILVPGLCE
ncbi:MAG: phosphohistidine phosphatase SixA [Candidatus Zixiibacteriota bacterium]